MSIFTRLRDFLALNNPNDYDSEPKTPAYSLPVIHRTTIKELETNVVSASTEESPDPDFVEISHGELPFYSEIISEESSLQPHDFTVACSSPMGSDLQEALEFLNMVEEERNQALRYQQELSQIEETNTSIEIVLDSMEAQGLTANVLEERRQAALSKGQSLKARLHEQRQKSMRQVSANPPIQRFTPLGVNLSSRPSFPTVIPLSPLGQTTM